MSTKILIGPLAVIGLILPGMAPRSGEARDVNTAAWGRTATSLSRRGRHKRTDVSPAIVENRQAQFFDKVLPEGLPGYLAVLANCGCCKPRGSPPPTRP